MRQFVFTAELLYVMHPAELFVSGHGRDTYTPCAKLMRAFVRTAQLPLLALNAYGLY